MSDYRRSSYSRDDPRVSRQSTKSPVKESRKSPQRDPRTRASSETWDQSTTQFTQQSQQLQTAYQHLQPPAPVVQYAAPPPNQYEQQNYYPNYNQYGYSQYQYHTTQANQLYNVQSGQAVQPGPPGSEEYPQRGWAPVGGYSQPRHPAAAEFVQNETKSEGVAEELSIHKASLLKERETYEERIIALRSKLDMLIEQKEQLSSKASPDRETLHIIKENSKLQVEIQNKVKDAKNVIEILTGLIGDKAEKERDEETSKPSAKSEDTKTEVNYKHYDPEIHWCRMCDVFPQSAKELLVHLHSKEHQDTPQEEVPWHNKKLEEPKFPVYEGAPIRRLPIKGLQFFVASTAWYCRLCDVWIGDLHCASQHLMSVTHSQNYTNFVEQNPHWEIEWLKDREKAVQRIKRNKNGGSDAEEKKKKKHKEKHSPSAAAPGGKEKKKKKRSKKRRKHSSDSSSSSSSTSSSDDEKKDDKSKSIRVAMRNKIKLLSDDVDDKWEIIGKLVEEERRRQELVKQETSKEPPPPKPANDNLMSQWMTISEPPDKDKQLLDSLKEKLKHKHDAEKAKLAAEYEATKREKDRDDYEKKRALEQRELREREEEEDTRRQRMSLKLKDMKFKNKDNYRRHNHSKSRSPEKRRRRSRSSTPEQIRRNNRNGRRSFDRSPHMRYNKDKTDDEPKREKKQPPPPPPYKKLPFIGRMPLFKNQKVKKVEEGKKEVEVVKEDYDVPRRSRFQPGNLARSFIPDPAVVCFPKLSSYPPLAPPPPALVVTVPPEPPKISVPKPPPPPKLAKNKLKDEQAEEKVTTVIMSEQDEYAMLYEDSSNAMMYNYGNMDYNMYQPPPQSFNFTQDICDSDDIPRSHTMPLEPPPLPPDDPNDDLAMLGISTDDMAAQMF